MAREEEKLKLGKGTAFVKSRLRRLPQKGETWEADFRALPKPPTQQVTTYLGLVVSDGTLLADARADGRPTVNDLATLLAHAMRRPPEGDARRPARLRLRGHRQWRELFSHLEKIGVEVAAGEELNGVEGTYEAMIRDMRERGRAGMAAPSAAQQGVAKLFPALAMWVDGGYGHVEVGDQEGFGFVVRALDYGGLVFEDSKPATLVEALASLERGLRAWFEAEGIELE